MNLEELIAYMKELLAEFESDFKLVDGADSSFHRIEGNIEVLEHLLGKVEKE